jgi:hypothetical protein
LQGQRPFYAAGQHPANVGVCALILRKRDVFDAGETIGGDVDFDNL